jgi:hypothetical protein
VNFSNTIQLSLNLIQKWCRFLANQA